MFCWSCWKTSRCSRQFSSRLCILAWLCGREYVMSSALQRTHVWGQLEDLPAGRWREAVSHDSAGVLISQVRCTPCLAAWCQGA